MYMKYAKMHELNSFLLSITKKLVHCIVVQ